MSEAIATTDRQAALPAFSFQDRLRLKGTGEKPSVISHLEKEEKMDDTGCTALAVKPAAPQLQLAMPWEDDKGMKPVSYEMAMKLTGDVFRQRLERISGYMMHCAGCAVIYKGWIEDCIRAYQDEVRAARDRWRKEKLHFIPGMEKWKEAFNRKDKDGNVVPGKLFPFSHSYYCQVAKGRKNKARAKALPRRKAAPAAYPTEVEGWKALILSLGHKGVRMVLEAAKLAAEEDARAKSAERHAEALGKIKAMLDASPGGLEGGEDFIKATGLSVPKLVYLISLGVKQGLWAKWGEGVWIAKPEALESLRQQAKAGSRIKTAKDKIADPVAADGGMSPEAKAGHEQHEEELRKAHPPYAEAKDAYTAARVARHDALVAAGAGLDELDRLDEETKPLYDRWLEEGRKARKKLEAAQKEAAKAKRSEAARKAAETKRANKEEAGTRLVEEKP